jgi:hypothetical protein
MTAVEASSSRAQIPLMLLSAGIFAYFGFATSWLYTGVNGQFLLFVALLDWTLKITAVVFAISAILMFVNGFLGNLLYSLAGIVSAVMFVIVAILDIMDQQHTAMHPLLLFIFAAWNGYGSWMGLQGSLQWRQAEGGREESNASGGTPTAR